MILRITYLTVIPAVISTVVLFILTHLPSSALPQDVHFNDKQLHYIAYFIVSFLYGISFSPRGKKGIIGLFLVAVMMCLLGAFDEYTQQFFDRTTDIEDYYADLKGIATGVGIAFGVWLLKMLSGLGAKLNISK